MGLHYGDSETSFHLRGKWLEWLPIILWVSAWTNNKYSIQLFVLVTGLTCFVIHYNFWDYRPEGTTTLTITTGTVHTPPFREQPMPPQIFDWRLLFIIVSPWRSRLSISLITNSRYTEVYWPTLTRGLLCDFSLQWCGYRFSFWDLLGVLGLKIKIGLVCNIQSILFMCKKKPPQIRLHGLTTRTTALPT